MPYKQTSGFHETNAIDNKIIRNNTHYLSPDTYGFIFKGPQFTINNPWYKNPQTICVNQFNYDVVDLNQISTDYYSRTNFEPVLPLQEYASLIAGFQYSTDNGGKPVYDNWMDYYKVAFRSQLSQPQERTLTCAILPKKTAHIHSVISVIFRDVNQCVELACFCSSLVLDFYIKTTAAGGLVPSRMVAFPLGIPDKYTDHLYSRVLMLNCLTQHYAELWESCYSPLYPSLEWSTKDTRLKLFSRLGEKWTSSVPLRNQYERRLAMVEIDVLVSMCLGLALEDLILMYRLQFPVLQQNERDTWYDQTGNIVFTCSKGLIGVGVDRSIWEQIKNQKEGETYVHTVDPAKSELYGGQQVTYYAPYTKCDRIEDYRRAWAHFEKIFKEDE